ncbi:GTP-binding protein [Neoroseomonas soli]|uniref:GTP-binding protein n=1 Tax=Neoroseomonas soli TaxID=1081025 RepID=A0A9X9WSP2_9PROT|nr:GTP-binding protein [Neoroseomonas soli]MBR0670171.1 GTP-binding protein [Neoroseomonas soli]
MTAAAAEARLPVTVLSGFLGSGKTTVLRRLLAAPTGLRLAVIVNDMAETNLDAGLLDAIGILPRGHDRLVELSNGCICCTLREELITEVAGLARAGRFDALVIESTGISEPMPVAAGFDLPGPGGLVLSQVARLDTMVTVVDGPSFLADYCSRDRLADRGLAASGEDARQLVELLADQVEFADVILLNKADLLSPAKLRQLVGLLRAMNPSAEVIPCVEGEVPPSTLIGTARFDPLRARASPGWARALAGEHVPESEEFGIRSFVWRARRPLDPQRFATLLRTPLPGVLRAKGVAWLADRHDLAMEWHLAGGQRRLTVAGPWWATRPRQAWPQQEAWRRWLAAQWQEPFGDRRQEIAFIGQEMSEARIRAALDLCLVPPAASTGGAVRGNPEGSGSVAP